MPTQPLISIITPSFNQAGFIGRTIESVRQQDYTHIEHIVVDGGSTDGTQEILRSYAGTYPLRWLSEKDKGQADAINKGFAMAKGEIIGWVNSDDTFAAGALKRAATELSQTAEISWVYGDGVWIDENDRVIGEWESQSENLLGLLTDSYYIVQPTVFFRRSLLDTLGGLDESLHFTLDIDFFWRMALLSRGHYIPQILATRRLHAEAKSVAQLSKFAPERLRILDKVFASSGLPVEVEQRRDQIYGYSHFVIGASYFADRNMPMARHHLWKAITLDKLHAPLRDIKTLVLILESALGVYPYVPRQPNRGAAKYADRVQTAIWWKSPEAYLAANSRASGVS
jgi:glycosyltransferase involved in cell wall biosynthesis